MLILEKFSSQAQCNGIILHNLVSNFFVLPPKKTHQIKFSISPNGISKIGFCGVFARKRTGFCLYASKNQRKSGKNDLFGMDGFEDFDKDDDLFEDEEEEDFEEDEDEGLDDEEEFIPLNYMKKWMKNKPAGFGEGKVYDTSVEDKLVEEIEQSRIAQLANINRLKNNPLQPTLIKEIVPKECKDGFRVRLVNLPKKKNIHRDLQLAFKGFPGLVDIVPVVSGNKKTRDPICKGFAFIRFRSQNDACRFVQSFTGKSIMFGKVQKQIKCEMDTGLDEHGYEQYSEETYHNAEQAGSSFHSPMEDVSIEKIVNQENMHESIEVDDDVEESEAKAQIESRDDSYRKSKEGSDLVSPSSSLKKSKEKRGNGKKIAVGRKKNNIAKLNVLGSSKRLKIREKELLIGVFSKYGANASLATREGS